MHAKPLAVGINCALGAREMRPYLAELSRVATTFVSSYPNAGLPNAFGQYDQHAPETGELVKDFAVSGFVNIVGGCCGTTPDHIRAIGEQTRELYPNATWDDVSRELEQLWRSYVTGLAWSEVADKIRQAWEDADPGIKRD